MFYIRISICMCEIVREIRPGPARIQDPHTYIHMYVQGIRPGPARIQDPHAYLHMYVQGIRPGSVRIRAVYLCSITNDHLSIHFTFIYNQSNHIMLYVIYICIKSGKTIVFLTNISICTSIFTICMPCKK